MHPPQVATYLLSSPLLMIMLRKKFPLLMSDDQESSVSGRCLGDVSAGVDPKVGGSLFFREEKRQGL